MQPLRMEEATLSTIRQLLEQQLSPIDQMSTLDQMQARQLPVESNEDADGESHMLAVEYAEAAAEIHHELVQEAVKQAAEEAASTVAEIVEALLMDGTITAVAAESAAAEMAEAAFLDDIIGAVAAEMAAAEEFARVMQLVDALGAKMVKEGRWE